MIIADIEIVTILIILLLGLPILWNARKNQIWKSFNFLKLINTINKSLLPQGIIGLILILLAWLEDLVDFESNHLATQTTYTYFIIIFFMYLPALGILNLIKQIVSKKWKLKT